MILSKKRYNYANFEFLQTQGKIKMAKQYDFDSILELSLQQDYDTEIIAKLCDALSSPVRLQILRLLQKPPHHRTAPEISKALKIPKTTLLHHLDKLEKMKLLGTTYRYTEKRAYKLYGRHLKGANIKFYYTETPSEHVKTKTISLGVGQFSDFQGDSFNFNTQTKQYSYMLDSCFGSERLNAQLIYTYKGIVTYTFNNLAQNETPKEISLSLEICSEAPFYDNSHLSDISFWFNGVKIAEYRCLGDYGERRGILNPEWWPSVNTQYGKLATLTITEEGTFLNGIQQPQGKKLSELNLSKCRKIDISLGNDSTAEHPGGFNIFGRCFGDYQQDVELTFKF